MSVPIARAALHTHPEPPASATAGAGLQTRRRAAYLQTAAAVCIFAGDRDEHPVADATKKVDPLSSWYFMQNKMPQNVWYQFHFGN